MANLLYFASLAETLDLRAEQLTLPDDCRTVADLIALLHGRREPFHSAFDGATEVLIAINQQLATSAAEIDDSDEIAFFPPVTGG